MHSHLGRRAVASMLALAPIASGTDDPKPNRLTPQVQIGFEWPILAVAGSFGRAEVGQLTDDLSPDVVILRGPNSPLGAANDQAILLYSPSVHRSVTPFSTLVSDIAMVPGAGAWGRDGLAYLDSFGLSLASVGDDSSQISTQPIESSLFLGALRLRVADYQNDGDSDIFGLRSDGHAILIATKTANGYVTYSFDLPAGLSPTDFCVVNTTTSGTTELALAHTNGLSFVIKPGTASSFTHRRTYASSPSSNLLTTLRSSPTAPRRVAWITGMLGSSDQTLWVADSSTLESPPVLFTNEGIVSITCADLDSDGDDDAVLGRTASTAPIVLKSVASTGAAAFSNLPWPHETLGPLTVTISTEPDQSAWPVLADLDGDADCDAVMPCESERWIAVVDGEDISTPLASNSSVPTPTIDEGLYRNDPIGGNGPNSVGDLEVEFAACSQGSPDLRLEVVTWRQELSGGPLSPNSVDYELLQTSPPNSPIYYNLDVNESGPFPFAAAFWIECRFVQINPATGRIVAVYPSKIYAFASSYFDENDDPTGPTLLALIDGVGDDWTDVFYAQGFGGVKCGGIVPKAALPIFPPGSIPRPLAGAVQPH